MKKPDSKPKFVDIYDHKAIESKWQKYWAAKKLYEVKEDKNKKKFYGLIEFPYPSGDGLHVGHIRSNTAMDVIARKRRAEGYNVLYPIGWDAFGLPTENYAIKTGIQPAIVTKKNTDIFRRQLKALGFSFDWSREIDTTDPTYYKWTQWIFLQFLKKGLAYKKKMTINWCPKDLIGLANEEVVDGKCERCGTPVEKREKEQWMLAITKYAERLDKNLDKTQFLEKIKIQQRNWIGKSEGAEISFRLQTSNDKKGDKRRVLIGTRNPGKIQMIRNCLAHIPEIELISLNDLEPIDDSMLIEGDDFKENSRLKSEFYFKKTGIPTISTDHILWIEKWPENNGFMFHIRKHANPKNSRATDEEVIEFLKKFLKDVGGQSKSNFHYAISYTDEKGTLTLDEIPHHYILQLEQSKKFWPGYPAEALLKDVETGVFKSEQSDNVRYAKVKNTLERNFVPRILGRHFVDVFTTRPDTLFGVTYIVLAPEHQLVRDFLTSLENKKDIEDYIAKVKKETDIERTDTSKEKTGVELKGIKVINPANNEEVPVWIADYVLSDYGTGAVMAVPAHDERDWKFAKKYGLSIKKVIEPCFITKTGLDAFRNDLPHDDREAILAIVRHWSENKYICLKWKKADWITFITGGPESGQTLEEGARNEIIEETGYKNPKLVKKLQTVHSKFFHIPKNVNRLAHLNAFYFELENGDKNELSDEEKSNHDVLWLSKEEVDKNIVIESQSFLWHEFVNGEKTYTGEGFLINSGKFDRKESQLIKKEITDFVGGKWVTKFKLRDWIFSRQRYWGEPIPVVHCEKCGVVPVPEKDLPVKLPPVKNYKPTETGESPLAAITKWVNTKCPQCVIDQKKTKYFIFDFDGVLGDTFDASLDVRVKLGAKDRKEALEILNNYFDKKPHHTRDMKRSSEQIEKDVTATKKYGEIMLTMEMKLFKDFIKEVKKYKNAKLAVVSSGSGNYVKPAVKSSGLKFTHVLAFEDSPSKEEKIERICKDWGIDVKDAYYFTDTKADVYELENLMDRSKLVGCAWGWAGFDKLNEILPEKQILREYRDIHQFFNIDCVATRETDTMPNWAGSSWYYLRYADPKNKKTFADKKKLNYWTPVDWYNGGMEHTTLHLLYSRFWHKFLFDLGLVPTDEPYIKRTSHGLILAEGGVKMSKSKGNVINPDGIVKTVGADSLRLYEMFMGPFDQPIAWDTNNIAGVRRFIERVWKLCEKVSNFSNPKIDTVIHKTIKKISEDIENMKFNTAISSMMIALGDMEKEKGISKENYSTFIRLLAPFAPHVVEELWKKIGNKNSIHTSPWPIYDQNKLVESTITIIIQINGKIRGSFVTKIGTDDDIIRNTALQSSEIQKWIEEKEIIKVIIIKNKLVNIVIKK